MTDPQPRLEHLDPATLTTDVQVRADLNLTKEFLASVREHGVLEPIVAYPDPINDGAYRVHLGHRRTAAAVEVGRPTIPVYIISEREAEERLAEQLVENMHRAALTAHDEAQAYKQLSLFGLPAATIARRTSTKLKHVGQALAIADKAPSDAGNAALTFDQLAVIAEFADDADDVQQLTETATNEPDRFAHVAQTIRSNREAAAERAECEAEITAAGAHILDAPPSYSDTSMAYVHHGIFRDKDCTDRIPDEEVLAAAGDHLHGFAQRHWDDDASGFIYVPVYFVSDHRDLGWHTRYDSLNTGRPAVTEEVKAQRRQDRTDKPAWIDAATVRDQYIRELLQRAKLPDGTDQIIADHVAGYLLCDSYNHYRSRAADWLGYGEPADPWIRRGDTYVHRNPHHDWLQTHPGRARHLALAFACAAMEEVITNLKGDIKPWRDHRSITGPYLEWLATTGYGLSDIEQRVVDNDRDRLTNTTEEN